MTAVRAADVERRLARLPPEIHVALLYGPDGGQVSDRARGLAEAFVEGSDGPFRLVALDGDLVAEQPGRLFEEASTYGLFGGRRSIRVGTTSRNIADAVAACLERSMPDLLIVIEAGNLTKSSPLRGACEASPLALAMPCYGDSGRDLAGLVDEVLRAENIRIDDDARDLLLQSIGGDRLSTRSELAKLALYCRGTSTAGRADVEAVISDAAEAAMEEVVDAAFGGRLVDLEAAWQQHLARGTHPAALLAAALRHALGLLSARSLMDGGQPPDGVIAGWRGLGFPRRDQVKRQLARWPAAVLRDVVAALQDATLRTRQLSSIAPTMTAASLGRIAAYASSRPPLDRSARQTASS